MHNLHVSSCSFVNFLNTASWKVADLFFVYSDSHVLMLLISDKKDPDPNVDDAKYFPGGYYKHFPIPYHRRCKYHCGYKGCCSEEEFAVFSLTQMNDFDDDKHGGSGYGYGRGGYGYGPGYGYGHGGYGYRQPPPCHYRCGYRCCSAEEYAEYVQAGN